MTTEVATTYRGRFGTLHEAVDFVLAHRPAADLEFTAHISTDRHPSISYRVSVTVTEELP